MNLENNGGGLKVATIRNRYFNKNYNNSITAAMENKINEYLDYLPVGSICCSAELKELIFGEIPKERMQLFERACKSLMLAHGFVYIDMPYTIEYKRQRCYQKVME